MALKLTLKCFHFSMTRHQLAIGCRKGNKTYIEMTIFICYMLPVRSNSNATNRLHVCASNFSPGNDSRNENLWQKCQLFARRQVVPEGMRTSAARQWNAKIDKNYVSCLFVGNGEGVLCCFGSVSKRREFFPFLSPFHGLETLKGTWEKQNYQQKCEHNYCKVGDAVASLSCGSIVTEVRARIVLRMFDKCA